MQDTNIQITRRQVIIVESEYKRVNITVKMKYFIKGIILAISVVYTFAVCSEDYGSINQYGRLDVTEGIERITEGKFNGCKRLRTLFLPDSVQAIEEYAFANSGIQRVLGGEGLKTLENWTFANCTAMRLFDPPNMTRYEWYSFNNTDMHAIGENPPYFMYIKIGKDGHHIF